ncbi:histidine kinase [Jatrophihabitans sp. GAS493]|uniref:sensor histidine kinase n=1 Tax=Jatrophihabitans sp. GAS493 TaxID=1907575 RepID=UPI000BB9B868|nr:histidine kinase [Jatrophihabitans sp. GAS493]SOD75065.1 histidine kinase [Jatrophihabitans sp. GAS493]
MLTDLLVAAAEINWFGPEPPDLGDLLRRILSEAGSGKGLLMMPAGGAARSSGGGARIDTATGQHVWRVQDSTSTYRLEDSISRPPGTVFEMPGGVIVVSGIGRRDRARLTDVVDQLTPVWRLAQRSIEMLADREQYEVWVAEIGRLRVEAAAGMDVLRRRLERDLHDGAQNELVALTICTSLLAEEIHDRSWDDARAHVAQLADRLEESERTLARAVSDVSPDALREDGLLAALRSVVPQTPRLHFADGDDPPRRYPPAIEVTAHYIALEAITNALKHAPGAMVHVRVTDAYGRGELGTVATHQCDHSGHVANRQ